MNLGELETLTNYDIRSKFCCSTTWATAWSPVAGSVLRERYSGSDKPPQEDFVKAAEADGYRFARRVVVREDLADAMAAFLSFDGLRFSK